MKKFVRLRRKARSDAGPLVIEVNCPLDDGAEPQTLEFRTPEGRLCRVIGGLPDILMGEPEGQNKIITGTNPISQHE